jgi:hypothetical protein
MLISSIKSNVSVTYLDKLLLFVRQTLNNFWVDLQQLPVSLVASCVRKGISLLVLFTWHILNNAGRLNIALLPVRLQ